tara:strand:+ start:3417 stop:4403 length:987 start_codon:yes stop_codon:yes gene_type:complete
MTYAECIEYCYDKYVTDKEHLLYTLDKYGVAIIPDVLNSKECEDMISGIWDYYEKITENWENPINRNDQKTYKEFYKLYPSHSMLFQHWNIGHAQVNWDIRQNTKILEIWAYIYDCKIVDLLASFDGLSFNIPPEFTNRGWETNNSWLHCDQKFSENNLTTIQSWVTGLDVNSGDATLRFLEKSNQFHQYFKDEFEISDKTEWYKLDEVEKDFYINNGCLEKKIKCPKGSLVFWDSRTIHSGCQSSKTREYPNFRAIIYLCYLPRSLASKKELDKKKLAFQEMRTCKHNPIKNLLFAKTPRTYGGALPIVSTINRPLLETIGYKLAGF